MCTAWRCGRCRREQVGTVMKCLNCNAPKMDNLVTMEQIIHSSYRSSRFHFRHQCAHQTDDWIQRTRVHGAMITSFLGCASLTPLQQGGHMRRHADCLWHHHGDRIYRVSCDLCNHPSAMTTTPGKRKLPRSTLPYLGILLDRLFFSKLPTNKVILQRLMFEIEHNHGAASLESAALTTQKELFDLWEYAGYKDILKPLSNVLRQIRSLHQSYKALKKIPESRRHTDSFKKKEAAFTSSLDELFDIADATLKSSNLITKEDRDFLNCHWQKTISSTADHKTRNAVLKKLARKEKSSAPSPAPTSTPTPNLSSPTSAASSSSQTSQHSDNNFHPKWHCSTPRSVGTPVVIPRDILKRVGPAADRLGVSHQQATALIASVINNSGGDLDSISISTSTARRARGLLPSRRTSPSPVASDYLTGRYGTRSHPQPPRRKGSTVPWASISCARVSDRISRGSVPRLIVDYGPAGFRTPFPKGKNVTFAQNQNVTLGWAERSSFKHSKKEIPLSVVFEIPHDQTAAPRSQMFSTN